MRDLSQYLIRTIAFILGGGRGQRLYPLTKFRAKPAVPFAGNYRLIDIPVSNCIHSGIHKIYIMTQFQSASLNRHISRTYKLDLFREGFVDILASELSFNPAESGFSEGTADAVRKGLKHVELQGVKQAYILILAGDQLYRMNYQEMLRYHLHHKARITIAVLPIHKKDASRFGIIKVQEGRVVDFLEKPDMEKIPLDWYIDTEQTYLYGSMGIYIFDLGFLRDALYSKPQWQDFGKEVLPSLIHEGETVAAYTHKEYWEDIGTISSFHQAHMDLISPLPPFDLYQSEWPFFFKPRFLPPTRCIKSEIECSLISDGVFIQQASLYYSVVGIRTLIKKGTILERAIIMGSDYFVQDEKKQERFGCVIGEGCELHNVIVDKNCIIGNNVKIINQHGAVSEEREFYSIVDGVVVIPKNTVIPDGMII